MTGLAQWFIPPGLGEIGSVPAACSASGPITDVVMWTTGIGVGIALGRQADPHYSGDVYTDSPHAIYRVSQSDGWVRIPYDDPGAETPWDGGRLMVRQGDPLWIETDTFTSADMVYFAALIGGQDNGPPGEIVARSGPSGVVRLGQRKP